MIESTQLDVILGTETWLSTCNKICTAEVCPPEFGYDVIRRDREGDAHWGVFIAAKTYLSLNHLLTSKDSELISGCIIISPRKKLITSCLYRPPNRQNKETTDKAIQGISDLRSNHKNIFILGGDLNFSDIDWVKYTINGSQTSREVKKQRLHADDMQTLTCSR